MKHKVSLFLLLLLSLPTMAQDEKRFFVEPKIGLTISNLTQAHLKNKTSLCLGADCEYFISKPLSASLGMMLSIEGAKGEAGKLNPTYLNFPLLGKLHLSRKLAIETGVQLGVKFSDNREDFIIMGREKTFSFAIPLGMSYYTKHWVWDARYNWGLTNVYEYYNFKSRVFQVSVGYKL